MLDQITPLILTLNEAPNIARTLEQLAWAKDIVVVDSFSDDETQEIISSFSNVRLFERRFDNHERQWNFGLNETGISTEWVMALDADYVLTHEFTSYLGRLRPPGDVNGYSAAVTYCIHGRQLRSAIYPPVTFLYRHGRGQYVLDGHTQRVKLDGRIERLPKHILHDDRKSLSRWLQSQHQYARLEGHKLLLADPKDLDFSDRVRRLRLLAPFLVVFYCLVCQGGVLDGWAGLYYAFQRLIAEVLLSLYLLEHDLTLSRTYSSEGQAESSDRVAESASAVDKQNDALA